MGVGFKRATIFSGASYACIGLTVWFCADGGGTGRPAVDVGRALALAWGVKQQAAGLWHLQLQLALQRQRSGAVHVELLSSRPSPQRQKCVRRMDVAHAR